jgi:hypothetical protein
MSSTIYSLVSAIKSALVASSALSDAVKAALGASAQYVVDVGFDPDDPPEMIAECAIYITAGGRSRLSDLRRRTGTIDVAVVVKASDPDSALAAADAIAAVVDDLVYSAGADAGCAVTSYEGGQDLVSLPVCAVFLRYSAVLAR